MYVINGFQAPLFVVSGQAGKAFGIQAVLKRDSGGVSGCDTTLHSEIILNMCADHEDLSFFQN